MLVTTLDFRAAGVTFNNPDGSSRQKAINEIRKEDWVHNVGFSRFEYEGRPAFYILCGTDCVGVVPSVYVNDFVEWFNKGYRVDGIISDVLGCDEDGNRIEGYSLGLEICAYVYDDSVPDPEPALSSSSLPSVGKTAQESKSKKGGIIMIVFGVFFALGFLANPNPFSAICAGVLLYFGIKNRRTK